MFDFFGAFVAIDLFVLENIHEFVHKVLFLKIRTIKRSLQIGRKIGKESYKLMCKGVISLYFLQCQCHKR